MKNINTPLEVVRDTLPSSEKGSSLQHQKSKTVNVNMTNASNCKEREEYDGLSRLYTFDKICCCPMCLLTILLEDSCKINEIHKFINGRFQFRKHSQVYSPLCICFVSSKLAMWPPFFLLSVSHNIPCLVFVFNSLIPYILLGSAVAWWLLRRTPDLEVGGSSPTRVKPCCVLEQDTFTPQKYWTTQEAVAPSQHD